MNKKRGFTLIEILVTTTILSLGIVFIYEAFFVSLRAYNYYENYLNVAPWMDDKLWEVQDSFTRTGAYDATAAEGEIIVEGRTYTWQVSGAPEGDGSSLYAIELALSRHESKNDFQVKRAVYALRQAE
ncbi:MAG: prepilin-type N-terminal cleavage/methylation domain-containing protein [Candidatus Omnitrophota bacterium]